MKYPNVYLVGNCLYIQIDRELDDEKTPKYIKCSLNGILFPAEIYTVNELVEEYPDAKPFNTILDAYVKCIWEQK